MCPSLPQPCASGKPLGSQTSVPPGYNAAVIMPVAFGVEGPLLLGRDTPWLLQDTHHHGACAPSIHDASSRDKPKHSMLFQSCSQLENYRLTVPYQGQVSGVSGLRLGGWALEWGDRLGQGRREWKAQPGRPRTGCNVAKVLPSRAQPRPPTSAMASWSPHGG